MTPCSSSGTYSYSGRLRHDRVQGNCKRENTSQTRPRQPSLPVAGFSIGQRPRTSRNEDDRRGPGAYMSIWDQSQGPAYTFGGERTSDLKRDCDGPGPGEYASGLGYYATKSSAPAYSMGSRYGPSAFSTGSRSGAYNVVKGSGGSNCGATYKSGHNFSLLPGPGTYNTSTISGGPAYTMGIKSNSRGVDRSHSPGPGAYDMKRKDSGPCFSIASKGRKQVCQRDTNPGPGMYSSMSNSISRRVSRPVRERLN